MYRVLGLSCKEQQRCEIFVELGMWTVCIGAAHRDIKICYGALHLQITFSLFFATNIAVLCTFTFYVNNGLKSPVRTAIW
jgi:hypothetical protein